MICIDDASCTTINRSNRRRRFGHVEASKWTTIPTSAITLTLDTRLSESYVGRRLDGLWVVHSRERGDRGWDVLGEGSSEL